MADAERLEREQQFWDQSAQSSDETLADYRRGPEPNTRLMLEAVRPKPGMRILDVACGAGETSCWLAASGAEVTGVDVSPVCIGAARNLASTVGVNVNFIQGGVETLDLPPRGFDALVGRYALHHLDVSEMAPVLANSLCPGGLGAFVETMGYSPVLRFARDHVAGRFGVSRWGSDDEHPLREHDIATLRRSFAAVELTQAEYRFMLMVDRQAIHGRWPLLTKVARGVDRRLEHLPVVKRWSFHQVVLMQKAPATQGSLVRAAEIAPRIFERPQDETDAHHRH